MAGFMEVLQVKCIVPNLVYRVGREMTFANFKFQYEYNRLYEQDDIDSSPHSRYSILKIDPPFICG